MHGQTKFAAAWRSLLTTAVLVGIVDSSSAAETGDLIELRSEALELVNEAREQHGLRPLQSRPELDRAAQVHAEDMLNRNYFDHASPEGKTVFDRYVAAGGSRWRLVAENIGRCAKCKGPPRISDVTRLQDGWMRSATHRENIAAHLCSRSDQPRPATKGHSRAQAKHSADRCPPIAHSFDRYGV